MRQKVGHEVLEARVVECPEGFFLFGEVVFKREKLPMPVQKPPIQEIRENSILDLYG